MDCRTFDKRLEDYLEDGLDFPNRFAMERHAQQCFRCGKTVSDAQELRQLSRGIRRVTAPPDFEAAVLRRIREADARPRFRRPVFAWPAWGFAGAAAMAVIALGITLLMRRETPPPEQIVTAGPPVATPIPAPVIVPGAPRTETAAAERQGPAGTPASFATDFPLESVDAPDYVDLVVPGPGDRMRVVRLPKTIRMRYGQPSEQYFIRNVSH